MNDKKDTYWTSPLLRDFEPQNRDWEPVLC